MKKKSLHSISIIFYLLFFTPFYNTAQENNKKLTNETIWFSPNLYPNYVDQVRSMNDGESFSALEGKKIVKYSYENFDSGAETILNGNTLEVGGKKITFQKYYFNSDETQLLLANQIRSIYRRSWEGQFYIQNLKTGKTVKLTKNDTPQRLAEFSPDGKKVAYVSENNLYVYDIEKDETTTVTSDGKINTIINGTTDWVYEEEFAITKGFSWSANGTKIAYMKFNESDVKEFTMKIYGNLYPDLHQFKYPKAGEDNSIVTLHVYGLESKKTKNVNLDKYEYIPRIKWTKNDDILFALTLNRHQNDLKYHQIDCSKSDLAGKIVYREESETYVEIDDNLIFLKNEEAFIRTSEKDGYNHIYKINFNGVEKQITKGKWDVVEFKGLDDDNGKIYYISAEEGPEFKDVFVIDLEGKNKAKISTKKGTNEADFSKGMKYFINTWHNANTPPVITLHESDGKLIKTIEDNQKLRKTMGEYDLSEKEFLTVKGAVEELNAWMIKPQNFDKKKKYPVYMYVYGGPGKNEVEDAWAGMSYFWHQLLAQNGYIVLCVDPRGTMYRGEKFKKCTYQQLGKLETADLIAVAKEIGKWKYVDKDRIGIQGWSYGGYMSSLAITKGADYFKSAIAVAPVTNWRYYDNIYTERFMRTPQENPDGYDDNSPINHVEKIKGNYLLIHGSGDDNVHYQNTMEMVNALVNANKQFELFIYPNRNHGIYGGTTRLHLFNKMLDFTLDNL